MKTVTNESNHRHRLNEVNLYISQHIRGASQVAQVLKNPTTNAGDARDVFNPWAGKIPWRRKWKPTPVFLPGESHRQRSWMGYRSWGRRELDVSEQLCTQNKLEFLLSQSNGHGQSPEKSCF